VRSDDSPPLLERISDYVAWYAERWPRQEALVLGARRIDYSQLAGEVDALSRSLLAAGVRRGDRVATLAPPHPDFFIVFLAAVSIGAIWVGLNPRYQRGELEFVLTDSRPTLVFARTRIGTRDYAGDIAALQSALPTARWVVLGDDPVPAGGIPYLDYIAASMLMTWRRRAPRFVPPMRHSSYTPPEARDSRRERYFRIAALRFAARFNTDFGAPIRCGP
jgi:acyl-CoA synthetase (AMP-forming)/AMP-acid ligase II